MNITINELIEKFPENKKLDFIIHDINTYQKYYLSANIILVRDTVINLDIIEIAQKEHTEREKTYGAANSFELMSIYWSQSVIDELRKLLKEIEKDFIYQNVLNTKNPILEKTDTKAIADEIISYV